MNELNELKKTVDSTLWIEKYKPATLDDVLIEGHLKKKFKEYIEKKDIGNLLFQGSAGNGKTTCAKIIAHSISDDVLFINASSETGIDVVRHKIEPYCATQTLGDSKMKIVILDEMEMASDNFQTALREVIEKFYSTTRFIFTCNFINKVIEPLRSRTQEFKFGEINQLDIAKRCVAILKAEKVEFEQLNVVKVVKSLGTDVRRILNMLQRMVEDDNGKLVLSPFSALEEKQMKLLELIKQKKLSEVRKYIGEHNLNPEEVAKFLFNKAFDKQISKENWVTLVGITGEAIDRMRLSVDSEITLIHHIIQIMNVI